MYRPLELFIGLRYTRSKARSQFLSLVSLFALLGMVLGIAALIVVSSVMNGFGEELQGRILRFVPHGYVDQVGGVKDWRAVMATIEQQPTVVAASPYIGGGSMLSFAGEVKGAEVRGIMPALEHRVSGIAPFMTRGSLEQLVAGDYGIVLGAILARQLRVTVGDKVTLVIPKVSVTPAGVFPRMKRFTVVGLYQVGAQQDATGALIHLDDAAVLYQRGDRVDGLQLRVDDLFTAATTVPSVVSVLNTGSDENNRPFDGRDWTVTQGSLFKSVKMEKTMVSLLLLSIVAVAAFNIISILTMMVAEKRKDIAVLRTLGMTPLSVVRIFLVQGMFVGLGGTLLGLLIGIPLAYNIGEVVTFFEQLLGFHVFDPRVYYISKLPSVVKMDDVIVVASSGFILSILATLYPAWRAGQIQPAEALRYE
ncbi:lipoprotein-releasing ABC transporter permease subunit [Sinobacterium norvegicum]|nr:lipoprotein-releasing ABC transporter permease subunit [Sinobacterium norvegicum]